MDWNKCLICQEKTAEPIKCPLNANGSGDKSDPYSSFLNNVGAFRIIGTLPVALPFSEDMTVCELVKNQAAWHKSCYVKFSKEKLERATKKRERDETSADCSSEAKRPRRLSMIKIACLFCQQVDGHLHEVRTLGADENIRQMATELHDTELMARMEGGDLIALDAKYHLEST
jgi:hypothetical protein